MSAVDTEETRVACIQYDNRNLEENSVFRLNLNVNSLQCKKINVAHYFFHFKPDNPKVSPVLYKTHVVREFMEKFKNEYDVIVNLDVIDAFIYDAHKLKQLIDNLMKSERYGMFSRDPNNHEVPKELYRDFNHHETKEQTYINTGSYIIKNTEETRNFMDEVINLTRENSTYYNRWPYDQYYLSKSIYNNRFKFYVFKCTILNTPYGEILRHNWCKNQKLINDMMGVMEGNALSIEDVNLEELVSTAPYINTGVFLL